MVFSMDFAAATLGNFRAKIQALSAIKGIETLSFPTCNPRLFSPQHSDKYAITACS
ncbi:Uncharacterised protein [Providencia rustigianii]|nr:Uncharacterised protein [Providencia rustigianii]